MPTSPSRIGPATRGAALATSLILAATLTACGSSSPDDASATSSTTTSSTTSTTEASTSTTGPKTATTATTTTTDPGTPPPASKVTVAYVKRVLDSLHGIFQLAFASAVAEKGFGEKYLAAMGAAFTAKAAGQQTDGIKGFGGLAVVRPQPGRPSVSNVKLLQAAGRCIFASADIDLTPLVTKPIPAKQPYYVKLVAENKSRSNTTPWLIDYESYTGDGKPPPEAELRCTP